MPPHVTTALAGLFLAPQADSGPALVAMLRRIQGDYAMTDSLKGKAAVVAGGASGIGQGIATCLALNGMNVLIGDKDGDGASNVAHAITQSGGTAFAVTADLGQQNDSEFLVDQALLHFGQIDNFVNCVATWNFKRFEQQTWLDLVEFAMVNFVGLTYLTQLVCRSMRERHVSGSVVEITSIHAEENVVRRWHPPYSCLKAAARMLVSELAVEYGCYGIRVNAIAPGHVETDRSRVARSDRTPNPFIPFLGESLMPEDVAQAALWLADSTKSGRITGTTLTVDGAERCFGEHCVRVDGIPNRCLPDADP